MARRLRYMPPEGSGLVEVTTRTVHGRFLLAPSAELNDLILGALGRAQELYPINLVAFAFASGHYHLLLRVDDTRQLSSFMNHFNSNLAREAGRLADWREKFWSRRFQAIPISDDDRPVKLKRSPAPLFHAASRKVRRDLYQAYSEFLGAFRTAAEKLRAGTRDIVFPAGCFPPALPWVTG